jgi:hypothetical protein
LAMDSQAFLDELVCLPLIEGVGGTIESILLICRVADISDLVSLLRGAGMQIYDSFSGCRNHSALDGVWEMGYSLIYLRSPDPTSPPCETSTQLLLGRGVMTHLAALC